MCCIGFGGPGIGVSIVHLASTFPRNQFTALSLLNGSIFYVDVGICHYMPMET